MLSRIDSFELYLAAKKRLSQWFDELMPASLERELNYKLLRGQPEFNGLGFNGLIITDSTTMAGFTLAMSREKAVPATIAAGCDMFLFTMDLDEDLDFMMKGLKNGVFTMERLDDAVTRILALKASLKLHKKAKGTLVPNETSLTVFNCSKHKDWAKKCADQAITLVKDTQELLPLTKEKRRILLYLIIEKDSIGEKIECIIKFIKLLEERDFIVTKCTDNNKLIELLEKQDIIVTKNTAMNNLVGALKNDYDLVLYFAYIKTGQSIDNVPKFINDIPTVFISLDNPYLLKDVPRVKTFINCYTLNEDVVKALIDKLMDKDKSLFKGKSPIDPFCDYWEAKL